MTSPRHALSIDVEDWNNGARLLVTGKVTSPTTAVIHNTERMFHLVEELARGATWFFLGEIAEHFPSLVKMVAEAGHEVGVHGYHHEPCTTSRRRCSGNGLEMPKPELRT